MTIKKLLQSYDGGYFKIYTDFSDDEPIATEATSDKELKKILRKKFRFFTATEHEIEIYIN